MPVALHPTKWWNWCMQEDERTVINPFFIDEK